MRPTGTLDLKGSERRKETDKGERKKSTRPREE